MSKRNSKQGKQNRQKKLYMVGIDSAALWILEQSKNEKGMEPLKNFISKGRLREIESTMPPMTGPAWPTIYTGKQPSVHGVPDFFYMKRDYTPDIAFFDSDSCRPFWDELAESGCKCLLITPAMQTRIDNTPNVEMITGFPLRSKANTKELEQMMQKHDFFGEPDIEKFMKSGRMTIEKGSKMFAQSVAKRASIAKEMMERHDYDFVYVCFTETDRLQHATLNNPKCKEYLLPIYREIFSFVGYAMRRAEKEGAALIIISDHGAQPVKSKFLINTFLIDSGYAVFKDSVQKDLKGQKKGSSKMPLRYVLREKLLTTRLRKVYDSMPYGLKKHVYNLSASFFSKISSEDYSHIHLYDLDMKKTRAFAAISNLDVGTIWINDGRFTSGVVGKEEKQRLKNEIIKKLRQVKSREGDKLFANVIDAKKYYGNTGKFIPADIFAEGKKGYTIDVKYFSLKSMFMKPELFKSGDHTRMGIFGEYNGSIYIAKGGGLASIAPAILKYYASKGR
ncbi:MAG: alkaline phosphatase family protein [Candidatus Micrarchaeota archaeon]|nr:alkaline phosphatase family protein [Candidatus Micrarchaeota archaeon]MDE1864425.1 alkaline phosphatase family protein [Candidatus Micrarchaeota archaeon]